MPLFPPLEESWRFLLAAFNAVSLLCSCDILTAVLPGVSSSGHISLGLQMPPCVGMPISFSRFENVSPLRYEYAFSVSSVSVSVPVPSGLSHLVSYPYPGVLRCHGHILSPCRSPNAASPQPPPASCYLSSVLPRLPLMLSTVILCESLSLPFPTFLLFFFQV